jgi:hypothetical protein
MHSPHPYLENCGKYLANRGKLDRITGLNIVNLTDWWFTIGFVIYDGYSIIKGSYAKTNVPTKEAPPRKRARLSEAHGNTHRSCCAAPSPPQGPRTSVALSL